MKSFRHLLLTLCLTILALPSFSQEKYVPTQENLDSRAEFEDARFGIFIHWGIYSMFGQGEWYLHNDNLDYREYAKAADGFYPHRFNADDWIDAIKGSGARYLCITSRHHDGFSMWDSKISDYNIVKATPFKRDVIGELAKACHEKNFRLHLYYSHLDWTREDYPWGRTGHGTGRDSLKSDWPHYYDFMNTQLTELLTSYGKIGAIWFDGHWDHDSDATEFDWQLEKQYKLIHDLQPACLVGNNHHINPYQGEDIQIFEKDLPGENTTGWSKAGISNHLPLETCETMNGIWGYKAKDQNYKTTEQIISLLVRTAGRGANLLLNIGPQPNGELPAIALQRLKEMGEWMSVYGETIYATRAGDIKNPSWGASTRRGTRLFIHVLDKSVSHLQLPLDCKVLKAISFKDKKVLKFRKTREVPGIELDFEHDGSADFVIELMTK